MKYKSGEEPCVGDIVRWQTTGGGSWREHEGEVVKLIPRGTSAFAEWPEPLPEEVRSGRIRNLDRGVLPIGKMDRVLVVVSRSGWERLRDTPRPFLKTPLPGSLKLVNRR